MRATRSMTCVCRGGQSAGIPENIAAVLQNLQRSLKGKALPSEHSAASQEDQAEIYGFLQELSQVQSGCLCSLSGWR